MTRMVCLLVTLQVALAVAPASRAVAQLPPIGIIDFYGLRHVSVDDVRAALRLSPCDAMPDSPDSIEDLERRLRNVRGV